MKTTLFVAGVVVLGGTFIFFVPRSYRSSWEMTGGKPTHSETLLLLFRIFGAILILIGILTATGMLDVDKIIR